jgi:manganese transport protein
MSVLGAVVMPHNLFLHSEIIQSRQWNLESEKLIKRQLRYEFLDTLFSMVIGWAINSALIILAATTFFASHIKVAELQQAQRLLEPLLGNNAGDIFAVALLFSGLAASVTSGIAGGSIFSGFFGEPYHLKSRRTQVGIILSLFLALALVFLIQDAFKGLLISQMILSIQLPFTIILQIYLTSSKKVMGTYVNSTFTIIVLSVIGAVIIVFNLMFLFSLW